LTVSVRACWILLRLCVTPATHTDTHAHAMPGFYHSGEDEKESEGKRTYYRVLEVNCAEDDAFDKLKDIMDKVFHNVATRVVVETPFEEGSDCAELVGKMRESLSNLHFSK
jgi:hypothetical protein